MSVSKPQDTRIKNILEKLGGSKHVAYICGIDKSNPPKWKTEIPRKHVPLLHSYSCYSGEEIPLAEFCPDLYDKGDPLYFSHPGRHR